MQRLNNKKQDKHDRLRRQDKQDRIKKNQIYLC